jgi:hypothetical protein
MRCKARPMSGDLGRDRRDVGSGSKFQLRIKGGGEEGRGILFAIRRERSLPEDLRTDEGDRLDRFSTGLLQAARPPAQCCCELRKGPVD